MEKCIEKDFYIIDVNEAGCIITAPNKLCMLYAVDALLQLVDKDVIKCCHIEDEAFMEFRGIHIAIPSKNQVEFLKNMVKYVFVLLNYFHLTTHLQYYEYKSLYHYL